MPLSVTCVSAPYQAGDESHEHTRHRQEVAARANRRHRSGQRSDGAPTDQLPGAQQSLVLDQVHVHPCVHANGTKVLYTADAQGYGQVFIVDVPDFDALPDRSTVTKNKEV